MKHKYMIRRMIGILLVFVMFVSGCSPTATDGSNKDQVSSMKRMKKEESNAISFDIIGGKDVFPIFGFYGPNVYNWCWDGNQLPDYFSDEMMELIKGTGINAISYSEIMTRRTPEAVERLLERCEEYELGYFGIDADLLQKGEDALTTTQIAERIAQKYAYDSYIGPFIVDEPSTPYFYGEIESRYIDSYKDITNSINVELDLKSYSSLFPLGAVSYKKDYEKYVKEYLEVFQPKYLSWDEYPFTETYGGDMNTYIVAMSILSKYAKANDIPLWMYIQAGDQWGMGAADSKTPYWPNEAQFNWNVNTGLAFGVQGIGYYLLIGNHSDSMNAEGGLDPYRLGMIGVTGTKNQWYYYAQNINKHIASMDHILMNSLHKGVIIKGEQAKKDCQGAYEIMDGESFRELQRVDGDVMIGCFNYNGKTALYVVNYSQEYAQHITLKLDAKHNMMLTQNAKTSYVTGESLTLDMAAGEGVLLVIE